MGVRDLIRWCARNPGEWWSRPMAATLCVALVVAASKALADANGNGSEPIDWTRFAIGLAQPIIAGLIAAAAATATNLFRDDKRIALLEQSDREQNRRLEDVEGWRSRHTEGHP